MKKIRNYFKKAAALIGLFGSLAVSGQAQSTVFNTPSTDVLGEKLIYVETDFIGHLDKSRNGGFQTYGVRTVYGLRRKVEIGVNAFYTRAGGSALPVEIQPNIKWQVYQNEKYGVSTSTGAVFFAPVTKRSAGDAFALAYANVSKKVDALNGSRLTAGYYQTIGMNRAGGTKNGVMFAYEQPVMRKVSFIADWYSGKNRFGYAAAGFGWTVTKKSTLYAGYNFGNTGRGNNSLAVFYGHTF